MTQILTFLVVVVTTLAAGALGQETKSAATPSATPVPPSQQPQPGRAVDLKASDGTILKATYFAAAKAGPGVLLFHQSNRTRKSWDDVAQQLANAGINTLTVDMRGHGDTGGKYDNWTDPNKEHAKQYLASDIDAAFQYLVSQPGVKCDVIGIGGAGLLGVDNSVQAARQHSAEVKSLALLSGETFSLIRIRPMQMITLPKPI